MHSGTGGSIYKYHIPVQVFVAANHIAYRYIVSTYTWYLIPLQLLESTYDTAYWYSYQCLHITAHSGIDISLYTISHPGTGVSIYTSYHILTQMSVLHNIKDSVTGISLYTISHQDTVISVDALHPIRLQTSVSTDFTSVNLSINNYAFPSILQLFLSSS
jgi:hypothetical protein